MNNIARWLLGIGLVIVVAWLIIGDASHDPDRAPAPPQEAAGPSLRSEEPAPGDGKEAGPSEAGPHLEGRATAAAPVLQEEAPVLVRGHVYREGTREPVAGAPVYAVMPWGERIGPGISLDDGAFEIHGPGDVRPGARFVVLGRGWIDTETVSGQTVGDYGRWTLRVREDGQPIVGDVEVVRAARLEGAVRLPDGMPAEGAVVRPLLASHWEGPGFHVPWRLVEPVRTDAHGVFAFDALPEGVQGHFQADLDGFPTAFSSPTTLKRGEQHTMLAFAFHAPRFVDVEVVSIDDGTPVVGAEISLEVGLALETAVSDEKGNARIGPFGGGEARGEVAAPGYLAWRTEDGDAWGREFVQGDDGSYRARVELVPAAVILGRVVLPEGVGMPDECSVEIQGSGPKPGEYWQSWALIQNDNTFRAEVPGGGEYSIAFELDDYEGKDVYGYVVAKAGAEDVVLEAELRWDNFHVPEGTPAWELEVVGPDLGPVLAEIEIQAEQEPAFEDLYDRLRATDASGRVRIPIDSRSRPLWVYISEPHRWTGAKPGSLLLGPLGPEGGRRTVRLPEARTIEGRVLTADGRPAQGLKLWCRVPEPEDVPADGFNWYVFHDIVTTDGRGGFVIEHLGDGKYTVAVDENDVGAIPEAVLADAGDHEVVIRLLPARPVVLRIADEDGGPVGLARIDLTQCDGARGLRAPYHLEDRTVETDLSGRVRIGGLETEGSFDMRVEPPDDRKSELTELRLRGWQPKDETIVLPRARVLSGIVQTPDGRPVPRARVGLWVVPERPLVQLRADEEGRFRFAGAPSGEIAAAVYLPGVAVPRKMPVNCELVVAGAAEPITLVLPSKRELYVEVGECEGKYERISYVTLTRIDGESEEAERFWMGLEHRRAHFFGLDPKGTYRLWGVEDYGAQYVLADAGTGVDRLDVKPQEGGEIHGRVLLPRPFMFAHIEVSDRGVEIEGSVEGDGSFLLRGVPPGRWNVWAHRRGPRGEVEDKKPAAAGESVDLDLRGE